MSKFLRNLFSQSAFLAEIEKIAPTLKEIATDVRGQSPLLARNDAPYDKSPYNDQEVFDKAMDRLISVFNLGLSWDKHEQEITNVIMGLEGIKDPNIVAVRVSLIKINNIIAQTRNDDRTRGLESVKQDTFNVYVHAPDPNDFIGMTVNEWREALFKNEGTNASEETRQYRFTLGQIADKCANFRLREIAEALSIIEQQYSRSPARKREYESITGTPARDLRELVAA